MTVIATFYTWDVVLQHPIQGFAKRFAPEAENMTGAVAKAHKMLRDKGYDDGEFIAISATRQSITRRIES